MEQSELQVHMNELAQKIAMLPPGSIVKKTVTGANIIIIAGQKIRSAMKSTSPLKR